MIFRPRIFISSTFRDNEDIRKKIRNYFYSVGAEPLLYENDLTPSILPMTYRENIKDSDFVILIVKDHYGTKTDWNISGTHEEYIIARDNKIPIHVYLKKNNESDSEDNSLIKILKSDLVSYYYFKGDKELLTRLKQTTFTIAKEIMISQITKNNLPTASIKKLAGNSDYNRALEVIQIIESMKKCKIEYDIDYLNTTLFSDCIGPIILAFRSSTYKFINWKLDELLDSMLSVANTIMRHHGLDYTSIASAPREYPIAVLGKVLVQRLSYTPNTEMSYDDYISKFNEFFEKYKAFKQCVQEMRTISDLV